MCTFLAPSKHGTGSWFQPSLILWFLAASVSAQSVSEACGGAGTEGRAAAVELSSGYRSGQLHSQAARGPGQPGHLCILVTFSLSHSGA